MSPHTTTALANICVRILPLRLPTHWSSYCGAFLYIRAHTPTRLPIYVSSYYYCARLYIWSSYFYAVTYIIAPSYSHLLAYICPHITSALACICVQILLRSHLYIYSALILPLSRVSASSIRLDNDQDGPQTAAAAHPEADEVESIAAAARAVFFLNKK